MRTTLFFFMLIAANIHAQEKLPELAPRKSEIFQSAKSDSVQYKILNKKIDSTHYFGLVKNPDTSKIIPIPNKYTLKKKPVLPLEKFNE